MGASGAIRAGRAYIEMFTDVTKLEEGFNRAAAKIRSWSATVSTTLGRFGGWTRGHAELPEPLQEIAHFATSPAGITSGLTLLTMHAAKTADELDRFAARAGVAISSVSNLKFVATMLDMPFEEIIQAIGKMQKSIATGKGGVGNLLGMGSDEQLMHIADMIGAIPDPALRAAKAMEIFGRSGAAMLPLLVGGSEKIKELMEEAGRLGFTADPEQVEKLVQAEDAIKRMHYSLNNLIATVGASLAPVFTKMADSFGGIVRSIRDFTKENKDAIATIYRVISSITAAGAAASILAVILPSITPLIGGAIAFMGSMITALLSPIGAVVGAVVALGGGFALTSETFGRAASAIWSKLKTLAGEITQIFNGVFDALVGGQFQLAWKIVCKGAELIWAQTVDNLKQAWNGLVDGIATILASVWKIWPKLMREVKALWLDFSGWFQKMWNAILVKMTGAMAGAVAKVVEGIGNALSGLWGMGDAAKDFADAASNIRQGLTYAPEKTDAQIDADTKKKKQALTAEQDRANQEIEQKSAVLLSALKTGRDQAEIDRLRAELDELIKQASGLPEGHKGKRFDPGEMATMPGVSVVGTFSAAAVAGLGGGSVFHEMRKELVEIKAHMGILVETEDRTLKVIEQGGAFA